MHTELDLSSNITQLVAGLTPVVCGLLEFTPKSYRYGFEYGFSTHDNGDVWEGLTVRTLVTPPKKRNALVVAEAYMQDQLGPDWKVWITQAQRSMILNVTRYTRAATN